MTATKPHSSWEHQRMHHAGSRELPPGRYPERTHHKSDLMTEMVRTPGRRSPRSGVATETLTFLYRRSEHKRDASNRRRRERDLEHPKETAQKTVTT